MEALGVIWEVAKSLFSCTNAQAAYVYKLQENLESLNKIWGDLQNKEQDVQTEIDRAESTGVMKRTNEVIGWLQEFQKLQEKMMKDFPNFQQVQSNRCLNGYCPKNCVSSYKVGKKIVESLNEVNAMLSKADKTQFAIEQPPKPVAEMPCGETIGLDLMVDKVWHSLEDDNVGIIGLYGMGGAGKTTLMKRIQSEFGKREHSFDLVLWAVVSKDCDINKIMTNISNRLGIDDNFWKRSSQDQRVAKIHELLQEKKFVLMLDDLWAKVELEEIGVPVPKESNNISKVVFTTRIKDVCAKMKAQKKFEVRCLCDEEAFELFCNKVGNETLNCHTEIPKLAHEMAKECGGLPLALITVGSAMAGVESYEAWMDARNNLRRAAGFVEVFRILKFSYDKLPDNEHKSCFLYCALYPEDFEIDIGEVIDRWIGEGFLDKDGKSIYDMYNQGKSIIEKLILSCLLEEVIDNELIFRDWSSKRKIKMHDVIRDMALWLGRDEDENKDKIVVQGEAISMSEMDSKRLNELERISIITTWDSKESRKIQACPNLITLCLNLTGRYHKAPALSLNFQSIKKLRVLDLSTNGFINLSSEIGELINLEFLNLSRSGVVELPTALKKLKNLRVLLMDCMFRLNVRNIPLEVIESLEQLKVFRFSGGDGGSSQEEEISLLEKLESLPKLEELSVPLSCLASVQRLFQSTKLRDCSRWLRTSMLGKEGTKSVEMSSLLSSMSQMKHLEGIFLANIRSLMDGSSITEKCHLGKLRQVSIEFCHSITHLTWLRYAPLLETLDVLLCDSIEEVVKEAKEDEQTSSDSNNHIIFTNLKSLRLRNMSKLVSIHKRALAFPSLKRIVVGYCPNLRKLPFSSSFASKNNLVVIQGGPEWWDNLEWDDTTIPTLLRPKRQLRPFLD